MSFVGIIANPDSGKDIRRLVSQAVIVDNLQKSNIVGRLLRALGAMGVERVEIMPDFFGIGRRALDGLGPGDLGATEVIVADMPFEGTDRDSYQAAARMRDAGARCIVILGGDGTCRVVAKACGEVPLLPISTGTNNVVPTFVEATVAGMAAGYVATRPGIAHEQLCWRHKRLMVRVNGELVDQALVDVALVENQWTGARAIWSAEALRQVFVTRAHPTATGLSALVAAIQPVSPFEGSGAVIGLTPHGRRVLAPIAPGLLRTVSLGELIELQPGVSHPVEAVRPAVLALDGEREVVLRPEDRAEVTLELDGPRLVDVERTMQAAVEEGAFLR